MEQRPGAIRLDLDEVRSGRDRGGYQRHTRALMAMGAVLAALATADMAEAHPHVWVTMKSELVYGPDGSVTAIKQAWTFDDMYSAFATQGLEPKSPGTLTRDDLAPLATENVTSLKEFEYFTFAKVDGRKVAFADPVDYWADYKDSALTLHFTLPVKTPTKASAIELEIYDPTYFVDFSFAGPEPLVLKDAPKSCALTMKKANDAEVEAKMKTLGEAAFAGGDTSAYGAMFANKVAVKCP